VKRPAHGSATAWFSHLDLLKYVIASGLETAFIVEDDVDWDVRIKQQVPLISDNVRNYTNVPDDDPTPYGTDWDVLWLGHCGSIIEGSMPEPVIYADDTRCKTELYSGWSKHFLRDNLAEDHRALQVSIATVCTFGYGVTKHSAQKVLDATARGADEAFDVSLSHACGSRTLRCLVVNPQIMNHYEPPKDSGYNSKVHTGDGQAGGGDEAEFEFRKGTTGNIMESARCRALFNDVCMRPPSEI
jgi:GR25 family glycosyltransferase involved in LPS biosynthesis